MKSLSIKIISKVDVVILNWNTGTFLQECVQSVIDYGYGSVGKIIVVDNDSTDDSLSIVEKMSQITLIKNKENYIYFIDHFSSLTYHQIFYHNTLD